MQKNKLIIGLALVIALVVILIVYLSQKNQSSSIQTQTTSTPTKVLTDLQSALQIQGELREDTYRDWLDENGNHLPLKGQLLLVGTVDINGVAKYGSIPKSSDGLSDLELVNTDFINKLALDISNFYMHQNFAKNQKNSQGSSQLQDVRLGFEKGELKCLSQLQQKTDPFAYLVCGYIDQEQVQLQSQVKELIDQKQAKEDVYYLFRVDKIEGDFAKGSAGSYGGGASWIAKKENGTWREVMQLQNTPMCSEVDKYQIPRSIYDNCALENFELRFPLSSPK